MTARAARPVRLGIVAGETSGDQLGGGLMRALSRQYASAGRAVEFIGIGGEEMTAAGLHSMVPLSDLSVNGFVEPLRRLPSLLGLYRRVSAACIAADVDAFIGVDFNVFNLLIERRLKRNRVRTIHYVSPSVYAWRRGRAHTMARSTDLLLTLYPFEPSFYAGLPLTAVCVGHPLAQAIGPDAGSEDARKTARAALGLSPAGRVIALLPGSRASEVRLMAPAFLGAAAILAQPSPAEFVIPCVRPELIPLIDELLEGFPGLNVKRYAGNARQALAACDGALVKSGTGTLEAMCIGRPMVVSYRLGRWSYLLAKRLVHSPFIALPNILAGRAVVPELLQDDATPEGLAGALRTEMARAIESPDYLAQFGRLRNALALGEGANVEAAKAVISFLGSELRR